MLSTRLEASTQAFYEWEKLGRGWKIWPYPVELEPPFRPFPERGLASDTWVDDGRVETLLSGLVSRIQSRFSSTSVLAKGEQVPTTKEPQPRPASIERLPFELTVSVPPGQRITPEIASRFLGSIPTASERIAFEIIGSASSIDLQFACLDSDYGALQAQARSFFPDAVITDGENHLLATWSQPEIKHTMVVDFGLQREFMLPLRVFRSFEIDPLIGITGAFDGLRVPEVAVLQVLFQTARHPWASSVVRAVTLPNGKPFFLDAPELTSAAREKVSEPLYAVVVRLAVGGPDRKRLTQIARAFQGALRQYGSSGSNALMPLNNEGYDHKAHLENLFVRTTSRSGMLLNLKELSGLVHLPSQSVRSAKLKRHARRTRVAPPEVLGHSLVLGTNHHAGEASAVTLSPEHRSRHLHVIGASGTGKSHLILNLLIQDLRFGRGIAVLDPHGDLIDRLLGYIPRSRIDDVVLFDPGDVEFPIGLNILQARDDTEKQLLASDLVAVFQRLSTSWGDRMTSVLANAILAFVESTERGTLVQLRRFLIEKDYRREFLSTVEDPEIVYFWEREFPLFSGVPQAPLLTRLDTFLRPRIIRNIVSQPQSTLDFQEIMDEGKIFLAKLSHGAIGESNAHLLGTLLVSRFYQTALSRQRQQESERQPFYLYIDEFHNFITPSLATILSGARKYQLGVVLAHQDMTQLSTRDPGLASSLTTNPCTRIAFRLGDQDARRLASTFSFFEATDLQTLGRGEAICRVERSDFDFNLETHPLPSRDSSSMDSTATLEQILNWSRQTYSTPRKEVESRYASPLAVCRT